MSEPRQAPSVAPHDLPGEGRSAGHEVWYRWAFAAMVLASLAPVWAVGHLPTLDGPAHLYIADVLVRYGGESNTHLHAFFEPHSRIESNYIIYPLLWAFLHVVPAAVAEKLLVTVYVLFFAASAVYLARSVNRADWVTAFLFLPLAFTPLFVLGLYNLSFGIAVFMVYLGFWWRHQGKATIGVFAGYGMLAGLAYLSHLLALSLIGLAVATLSVAWLIRQWSAGGEGARWPVLVRGFLVRTGVPAATALPLWLVGLIVLGSDDAFKGGADGLPFAWPSLQRVMMLLIGTAVTTHGGLERVAGALFILVLLVLAVHRARHHPRSLAHPLFVLTALLIALYLFLPSRYVISWIEYRLTPFVLIALVCWLAASGQARPAGESRGARAFIAVAAALVILLAAGGRVDRFRQIDALTDDYVSAAAHIEPRSTILALRLLPPAGAGVAAPPTFLQTVGYVAIEADGIDLKNYQLQSGIFPVRYRPDIDPYDHLADDNQFVGAPETIAPSRYRTETGREVDYVLLWGDMATLAPDTVLARELAAHYQLHYTSPGGLMRVFRRQEPLEAG